MNLPKKYKFNNLDLSKIFKLMFHYDKKEDN